MSKTKSQIITDKLIDRIIALSFSSVVIYAFATTIQIFSISVAV